MAGKIGSDFAIPLTGSDMGKWIMELCNEVLGEIEEVHDWETGGCWLMGDVCVCGLTCV